jgi:single-strand DNA-binding protein
VGGRQQLLHRAGSILKSTVDCTFLSDDMGDTPPPVSSQHPVGLSNTEYMNRAIIIGNIGRDPEIKEFDNGNKLASFVVATSEKYTDKSGQKQEQTEWHNVKFFGKLAEVCEKWLKKGSKVMVEGKITTRSYENKDGETKYVTEIVGQNMEMLGGNPSGEDKAAAPKAKAQKPLPNQEEGNLPF